MRLEEHALRTIVGHLAHMRAEYGEVLADPDLVLPNGENFPDAFSVSPEGITRLIARMATYAPLSSELEIAAAFVESDEAKGGGCGSGACSPGEEKELAKAASAVATETGYAVVLDVAEVSEPALLTGAIARALGRIVLFEAEEEVPSRDEGALAELTAVACGLGVLLLNGSCVYKKGCGGMRRHRGTFLETSELAMAVALFVHLTGKKATSVRRYLPPTQREAFEAALAWVDQQPKLVRALREHPETLTDGIFTQESPKGFLAKLFSGRGNDAESALPERISVRKTERTEAEQRRLAEARALVEEALQDG